ncbi:YdcF family protein [Roseomonas sp. SSH11]|uniref:YdcF family protein n=1 Tax=Pararoseomonas baculiformis TaxID=2820812 RepID=A0ABS4AC93_9PROT|nr:YdcF family protein [Pararoseomonas baculiformis]MBP0444635.1 YdcF family protein [Pararoseomonas baculiformis]
MSSAIVIFGAAVRPDSRPSETMRRRVTAAVELGEMLGDTPIFVPTGGVGRHGPAESAVMAKLLRDWGIDPARILEEPTGVDTLSSARAVAALLRGRVERVHPVSSGYHLPRCAMLLRLCGLRTGKGRAARPGPGFAEWRWRLREVPALPYDAVLAVWHRALRKG